MSQKMLRPFIAKVSVLCYVPLREIIQVLNSFLVRDTLINFLIFIILKYDNLQI